MKKSAEVFERKGQWFFQPSSRAPTGLWIATPPVFQIDSQAPRQTKGEMVTEALNASQTSVPMPEDTSLVIVPLLTKAGAKSWMDFIKNAKCVGLELEHEQLALIPHRRRPRSKGALQGIPGTHIVLSAGASVEEIGAAMEEAFSRCLP